jgi:hypothetical protein
LDRDLQSGFAYGETVAGLLAAAERGAETLFRRLEGSRRLSAWVPAWLVVAIIILMNVSAYESHAPLPLATWWHSLVTWLGSMSQPA